MRDGIYDYQLLKMMQKLDPNKVKAIVGSVVLNFDEYDSEIQHFKNEKRIVGGIVKIKTRMSRIQKGFKNKCFCFFNLGSSNNGECPLENKKNNYTFISGAYTFSKKFALAIRIR